MKVSRVTQQKRRGFTLVEVLLVLAILGLLAAVVVPQLLGQLKGANIDSTKASISSLEGILEIYALDHNGSYPKTNEGLEVLLQPVGNDPKWKGPYVKDDNKLPTDAWENPLQYAYPGEHNRNKPDIWSAGEDGESGTDDDITNWDAKA